MSVPAILTRPVGSTGEMLPVVGLGTWQSFDVAPGGGGLAAQEDVLAAFVSLGGRVVDSSPMYGHAEEVVGDLVAKLGVRDRLFLATKVWTSGRAAGERQMKASMRKMRAERLDLMQVHNLVDTAAHLDTMRAWKREGRIRFIGITHYTASAHEAVARVIESEDDLDFVQINYSVGEREAERRLLPLAKERGIAVLANRPFATGRLLERLRGRRLPAWAAEIDCESWPQVLLKFVVSHPAITCAIPATSNVTHLHDNMRAAFGRLPDEPLRTRIAADAL